MSSKAKVERAAGRPIPPKEETAAFSFFFNFLFGEGYCVCEKSVNGQCGDCVYALRPDTCEKCKRRYGDYPDLFLAESEYFDTGTDFAAAVRCWPDNLYCAVLLIKSSEYTKRPRDLEGNVRKALFFLSERERAVLLMRYRDGMLLREVGGALGISAEQVRQIQNRTLRKLRSPALFKLLFLGLGADVTDEDIPKAGDTPGALLGQSDTLHALGLNLRVFGALVRAGILTVSELAHKPDRELLDIPGIGTKGVQEIRAALGKYFEGTGCA